MAEESNAGSRPQSRGERLGLAALQGAATGGARGAAFAAAQEATTFLPPPYNFIGMAALQIVDVGFRQNSRERQERKRRQDRITANLNQERSTGLGLVVPRCYGECVVTGALAWNGSQNDLNRGRVTDQTRQIGFMNDLGELGSGVVQSGTATARSGAGDEQLLFVCEVWDVAFESIHAVRNVILNGWPVQNRTSGRPDSASPYYGDVVCEWNLPGEAGELDLDFVKRNYNGPGFPSGRMFNIPGRVKSPDKSAQRTAASTGDKVTRVTTIVNTLHDGEETTLARPPGYQFVLSGTPAPLIQANGTLATALYEDANGVRVGANYAAVILHFLRDDVDNGGLGIDDEEIDFAEWRSRGQERCSPVVLGTATDAAMRGGTANPNLVAPPLTNDYGSFVSGLGYGSTYGSGGDATNDDNTDYTSQDIRHSIHMPLVESQTRKTFLERMMINAPGSVLGRTAAGKLYLDVPDSTRTAAAQAGTTVINDGHLAQGTQFTVDHPGERTLTTRIRGVFRSLNRNGEQEGVVYPAKGSDDETAINARYGAVREKSFQIPGIVTKAHAYAWSRTLVAMSLRRRFEWMMPADLATHRNGDVVRLVSASMSLDIHVRIMERESRGLVAVSYKAIEFVPNDYAFYPDAKDSAAPDANTDSVPSRAPPQPGEVALYYHEPGTLDPTFPEAPERCTVGPDHRIVEDVSPLSADYPPDYDFQRDTLIKYSIVATPGERIVRAQWGDWEVQDQGVFRNILFARSNEEPSVPETADAGSV